MVSLVLILFGLQRHSFDAITTTGGDVELAVLRLLMLTGIVAFLLHSHPCGLMNLEIEEKKEQILINNL